MCSGIGTALYLRGNEGENSGATWDPSFSFVGPVVVQALTAGVAGVGSAIVGNPAWCSSCALWWCARRNALDRSTHSTVVMAEIIFVSGCGLATTAVSEALTVPPRQTL